MVQLSRRSFLGGAAALAGIPFNLAQSAVGAVIYIVIAKTAGKWLKKAIEK